MTGPTAMILPCGTRLHLQHGPIDLVIGADGDRAGAFQAAQARFESILRELVEELPKLRQPLSPLSKPPTGEVARRMLSAASNFVDCEYLTPMAAVAGAVAETVLSAMISGADVTRAFVNNGGDIALHLSEGQQFATAIHDLRGSELGRIRLGHSDVPRGIATSGRDGRSLSLGIADSVTVLAPTASRADVAATLIANAVDLPGHPGVMRCPADALDVDTDLGSLPVVTACSALTMDEKRRALESGARTAEEFLNTGRISGASLHLQGESRIVGQIGCAARRLEHV